ncbi:uncharacterized protein LOC123428118 [Hordeum vulgare subsp. vulgare]|uniref:F-box domain-containing protein n=1 Tax=Hordeum vulgare subsp. vulgare TaxID=112509 RepID=A0A8I6XQX2_HORVV|nr:uncharacterized protein LOC123428118 [Hordeum vulgare subsp. vulgare]
MGLPIPTMDMESPLLNLNVTRDEDRISALPDELLLLILERLDLRDAVRAGAVSTRWRRLPHQLSLLALGIRSFRRATLAETMDAFVGAFLSVCPSADSNRESPRSCAIKALRLCFYPSAPHLSSIGRAVEDVVSCGNINSLEFRISLLPAEYAVRQLVEFGQTFMSFSRAYKVAFRCLTRLFLKGLAFGDSDVTDLISACDKLKCLTLRSCRLAHQHSTLRIDTPCSGLQELEFIHFVCARIELIHVPKLSKVHYHWCLDNPPVCFGYVPELCEVSLIRQAKVLQAPFMLSECLSRSATNLSKLHLNFGHQMIWIQPEHPKGLTAMFKNLTDVVLSNIFPECDLSWTLFILEAAPALQKFTLSRSRHACAIGYEDNAEKPNVVWEPSKDLKHLNLKLLWMYGFEEEDKVTNYIRLVMERAVGLRRIELRGENSCKECDVIDPRRSQVDEDRRCRIKERLTDGSPSSLEIIMC